MSDETEVVDLRPGRHEAPPTHSTKANEAGPQVSKRVGWFPLDQDAYPGFKIQLWQNPPWPVRQQAFDTTDTAKQLEALQEIVLGHNGWRDFAGTEYPTASTADFWQVIPNEMAALILVAIDEAARQLPNLRRATRQR